MPVVAVAAFVVAGGLFAVAFGIGVARWAGWLR